MRYLSRLNSTSKNLSSLCQNLQFQDLFKTASPDFSVHMKSSLNLVTNDQQRAGQLLDMISCIIRRNGKPRYRVV